MKPPKTVKFLNKTWRLTHNDNTRWCYSIADDQRQSLEILPGYSVVGQDRKCFGAWYTLNFEWEVGGDPWNRIEGACFGRDYNQVLKDLEERLQNTLDGIHGITGLK